MYRPKNHEVGLMRLSLRWREEWVEGNDNCDRDYTVH